MFKSLIKKIVPRFVLNFYHKSMALLAAFVYGNPSDKLIVVGVTGTNGKSTTVALIAKTLEASGAKVGATSTVSFKVADKEWMNNKKMTMLGRFQLQKLLKQMVDAGCTYAVIETSSQGIEQYRHLGINYDYAVFTNLTPEHIEAHGGFENYKRAKGRLFEHLARKARKQRGEGQRARFDSEARRAKSKGQKQGQELKIKDQKNTEVGKIIIANVDDEYADYFLSFAADKKIGFTAPPAIDPVGAESYSAPPIMAEKGAACIDEMVVAGKVDVTTHGTSFEVGGVKINLQLLGVFNVYNALAAVAIALEEGLSMERIKTGLEGVKGVAGRMEVIDEGQPFTVIVDYEPEPASMGKLYETVQKINKSIEHEGIEASKQRSIEAKEINSPSVLNGGGERKRIIHVLGSCGGGRDKARRPVLGDVGGENADVVIVTNEDPYDDDPMEIINEVAAGAAEAGKELDKNLFKILNRKEAIGKAVSLAEAGDLVLITGKGSEQAMAVAGGKLIPWDDRRVVRAWLQGQRAKFTFINEPMLKSETKKRG